LLQGDISLALIAEKCAQEPDLSAIPQVDIEIDQVEVATQSGQVQVSHRMVGSTTVEGVSAAIKASNIVHLACHGVQDPDDATKSGFCLGDGRMTIKHLMDLSVANPFLAFLSACETAKGDIDQPDQVMHLAAAMLFCGFKSIVATMWYDSLPIWPDCH
jgi:CHAT domain-containing protein